LIQLFFPGFAQLKADISIKEFLSECAIDSLFLAIANFNVFFVQFLRINKKPDRRESCRVFLCRWFRWNSP